jgi:hypothetical protein
MKTKFEEWVSNRSKHAPTLTKATLARMGIAFSAGLEEGKRMQARTQLKWILEEARAASQKEIK